MKKLLLMFVFALTFVVGASAQQSSHCGGPVNCPSEQTDPNAVNRAAIEAGTFTPIMAAPDELQTWNGIPCHYHLVGTSLNGAGQVDATVGVAYNGIGIGCLVQGVCYEPFTDPDTGVPDFVIVTGSFFQDWNCNPPEGILDFVEALGNGYLTYKTNPNYNQDQPYPDGVGANGATWVYVSVDGGNSFYLAYSNGRVDEEDCLGVENWIGPYSFNC